MSLPIVILPTDEKWSCHQCGICCRGSLVPLDDDDVARLRSQKWNEHSDPPVRRSVHALQFAHLLSQAKTKSMDSKRLSELIETLAQIVPEESKPFFCQRRPPAAYANVLFRSMGIEFARLHPDFHTKPTWSHRVQLAQTLIRLTFGRGRLPNIEPAFPPAKLEDLEHSMGQLSPSVDNPLARLIEATSASYLYALADRRGWSVVDSIRGLAALFPIGLWLLRWSSHGRIPISEDMIPIVVALDRGQGYAPLTGQLQRTRLHLLSTYGELERLVVWYAR